MCGIYAYRGQQNASDVILNGLKRLDYRGYDSWGVGVVNNNTISIEKNVGKVDDIIHPLSLPSSTVGIGHTRWATHGAVTQVNAHPHYSTDKSFILAQNGIVENYEELKKMLVAKGYQFITQTDTEVIVRLIEDIHKEEKNLLSAVRNAFLLLQGRNTIIILTKNGEMIAARNGSPLVIGINQKMKELYLSSDTLSFAPYVNKMVVVENGQLVYSQTKNDFQIYEISTNNEVKYVLEDMKMKNSVVDKAGFDHFMLKEIYENPAVIKQLTTQDKIIYEKLSQAIITSHRVYCIGSGTAGIAAAQVAFYLRAYAGVNAISIVGADAQEYYNLFNKDDLIIAPSQSGETADVLEVLEVAKKKGVKIASYVNMPGSMITRMSDYRFMAEAGPEICVMSTKVFISQLAWGYLVAKSIQNHEEGSRNLIDLSQKMYAYINEEKNHQDIKNLAKILAEKKDIFLLSKYQNFQIVKEGMVKIIEASYHHAHAIPAGDLKHYAITLMENGVPVIAVLSNDPVKSDIINAVNEVKARGATIIGIGPEKHESFDYYLPVPDTSETSAIMNVVPLQLLAYYLAVEMGNNVDKPRNIAKSVTVK